MEEEKCKNCFLNKNKRQIIEYYEDKLSNKPSATQIIALGLSCFTLGVSLAKLFLK